MPGTGVVYRVPRDEHGFPARASWIKAHCHWCGHPVWLSSGTPEWAWAMQSLLVCDYCWPTAEDACIAELAGVFVPAAPRPDRDAVLLPVQFVGGAGPRFLV